MDSFCTSFESWTYCSLFCKSFRWSLFALLVGQAKCSHRPPMLRSPLSAFFVQWNNISLTTHKNIKYHAKIQLFAKNFAKPKKRYTFALGKMAEWSNAPVLKTDELRGSGGSNPSLSAQSSRDTALFLLCWLSCCFISVYWYNWLRKLVSIK